MEETNSKLDIYSTQELLIQDLDKKDFFKESFEDGKNKKLLERIDNYYDVIFKVFITYINNKIDNNDVEDIQLKSSEKGGEPYTDSMEKFRDFLRNDANSSIYKSLIKILDYRNIKLFKTIFRNKLFKYLTYFIYKLNLCSYNNKESIYYRIPQIFQKNITNKELDNYNLLNSFTINSVKNLTNEKDYQHNTHISLLNNKLTFLEKYGQDYKCYSGDSDSNKFVPLCKIKFNPKTIETIKKDLLIRNNHYVSEGIGKVVFGSLEKQEILDFLNYFTIIRFEIKDNFTKEDEYYMLKLDSQQIGFNKLIKHVKFINEKVIEKAIKDNMKYVDLMFPNEYFQDYVNKKEKQKSYIKESTYKDYTIESQGSDKDRFKSIRKYTLKVSDEDSYGNLKQFKHVLSPFHFFEFDHNETSIKYYLQPKILDDVNLNEYFKQVYLEGGNTAKFQKDMAYNLGIGALTSAMFIIGGPVGVAALTGAALVANETLKQTNMISESTASKVFMGTLFSTASAPVTYEDWGEAIFAAATAADIGAKNVVDNMVDAIKELKIKITPSKDIINNQTTKERVTFTFEDENNNSIAIYDTSNIILNGKAILVNPVYIDDNNKKIMTITVESNKEKNILVVEEGAFAIIAKGLNFSRDKNGKIITNKNKVKYEWTKTNQTKGGQKSQIGGRNTNFSGNMANSGLQEKYNKIASSVYTIDINNTNHHFGGFGKKEYYFTDPSSVNITKLDKIMIDLENFLKITGSANRVKEKKIYDIVKNQNGSDPEGFWKGSVWSVAAIADSHIMLPCIHKDIDSKNLITLFENPTTFKDDIDNGKEYINNFIEQNTILEKNMVEKNYYEYFTQLHKATKFNNDKDYILVFSNPHKNNQFRSDITINEIQDNPLVLLNHENYDTEDTKNNLQKVCEELIIHLRNVHVNIKEKQGELLPGVIILKGLKEISIKQKLIKIDGKTSQKDLDKMYKEEKESYAKKNSLDTGLSVGAKVAGGALLSHTLGSAIDCLPLVGTLTKTGITVVSAALASEEDIKKVEEEYAKVESIFHRTNRFINTNLTEVKIPNPLGLEIKDKTSEILGGKKRKRPKTIKKYKYKKNKTGKRKNGKKGKNGKKTNNSPKLMNAKKSNKKMTISQILINNLKK